MFDLPSPLPRSGAGIFGVFFTKACSRSIRSCAAHGWPAGHRRPRDGKGPPTPLPCPLGFAGGSQNSNRNSQGLRQERRLRKHQSYDAKDLPTYVLVPPERLWSPAPDAQTIGLDFSAYAVGNTKRGVKPLSVATIERHLVGLGWHFSQRGCALNLPQHHHRVDSIRKKSMRNPYAGRKRSWPKIFPS